MSDIEHAHTTSADGTPIAYFRRGSGPALVVTHGSIATKEQWLPASEALAEHVTLYVYDRRGRGGSGDAPEYSLDTEVADIAAMMAVAGPGAHLLGHSFGALATLAYARRHGLSGGTLIAYEPPLAVQGPSRGERLAGYRELVDAGDLDGALEYALVNFVRVPPKRSPSSARRPLGRQRPRSRRPGCASWWRSTRSATTCRDTPRSTTPPTSSPEPRRRRSCTSRRTISPDHPRRRDHRHRGRRPLRASVGPRRVRARGRQRAAARTRAQLILTDPAPGVRPLRAGGRPTPARRG